MAQLSTAVSDLVLALASFYAAYHTNGHPYPSSYGLLVIGIAASLGVCRFGLRNPGISILCVVFYIVIALPYYVRCRK